MIKRTTKSDCQVALPLFSMLVSAGSPTAPDDGEDERIDLGQYLVRHPESTYLLKVEGESMIDAFVAPGDILVVDRALAPRQDDVVIALVNGEFTVKTFSAKPYLRLISRNPNQPIEIIRPFTIWGVVVWALHKTR